MPHCRRRVWSGGTRLYRNVERRAAKSTGEDGKAQREPSLTLGMTAGLAGVMVSRAVVVTFAVLVRQGARPVPPEAAPRAGLGGLDLAVLGWCGGDQGIEQPADGRGDFIDGLIER